MDIRHTLASNVLTLRMTQGMSQEELAACIDVDQAYVSRLEGGKINPTLLTIWHLAQALKTTPSKLLLEDEE